MSKYSIKYRLKLPNKISLENHSEHADSMKDAIDVLDNKLKAQGLKPSDYDVLYAVDVTDINSELLLEIDKEYRKHF